ncbi:FAD-dependent oxidoreductase [Nocardia sp. NPDC005978]|uniref:NAD(P)/FAD-dependent oxidoreductase n=1 Tax=Nocardia sp. NPDC005978 TaxID=3156725 RepID=UPI0033A93C8C
MTNGRIVIVGAGIAGATAARTLRTAGYTGAIVLIGAEDELPYRRPMVSKEMLAGTAVERRTLLEPGEFWQSNAIEVRTGVTVASIEPDRARVLLTDGEELGYDSLLLATGARPRGLPGAGAGVHTLRGRSDVAAVRSAIDAGSLLIVGAGLIGCEVASTATKLGARVTMLDAGAAPLDRIAPPVIGEFIRKLHADNGVDVVGGVLLTDIEQTAPGTVTATAEDGRAWNAHAALVAIGAIPNISLASAAGIAVADGILVDERYRTSAPGVYAAGDVAARLDLDTGVHRRDEHWNSAQAQGAAAAAAMLGTAPETAEVCWGWSTQYGLNIQFAGRIEPTDELVVRGAPGTPDLTVLGLREGRLAGAVGIGRPADIRAARELIARRTVLDPAVCADETVLLAALVDLARAIN